MANIQERRDKNGKLISFSIRVHRGRDENGKQLKPYTKTFPVDPSWKETTARRKAEAEAAIFEQEIKSGRRAADRRNFREYCEYVLELKKSRKAIKGTTTENYEYLTSRIYPQIGHIKLCDLRADDLNKLYTELSKDGINKNTGGKLSDKTILEHHRLISSVLAQAKKEQIVPHNVAEFAEAPKRPKHKINYFQPNQIADIRRAFENVELKWKAITHLLLLTGARRGEIIGLKWENINFDKNEAYICNSVLYTSGRGVYEDDTKSAHSDRYVALPAQTMELLKEYKKWQDGEKARLGEYYVDEGFLFTQPNGKPIHPSSVTSFYREFSKKNNLPHMNPHAFRHTMASMLYFSGVDSVSISNQLGHAQVSTTTDIYAHVIDESKKRNAEIISEIFLKNE